MDAEARFLHNILQHPKKKLGGLKAALRSGIQVVLVRELKQDSDTIYRSCHNISG